MYLISCFRLKSISNLFHFGKRLVILSLLLLIVCCNGTLAQVSMRDSSITFFMPSFVYGGYMPGGEIGTRFGYTSVIGADMGVKFKQNFYITLNGNWLVGESVKDASYLQNLSYNINAKNASGTNVIVIGWLDYDGRLQQPTMGQRGFVGGIRAGYIFNKLRIPKTNPNCGPFVEAGFQFISHKIRMTFESRKVSYYMGDYLLGYDRLTQGFGAAGSVGYRHFSNNRFINFFVAFDFQQYLTYNKRGYNYDQEKADTGSKKDILLGFRVGWTVPIYRTAPQTFFYY